MRDGAAWPKAGGTSGAVSAPDAPPGYGLLAPAALRLIACHSRSAASPQRCSSSSDTSAALFSTTTRAVAGWRLIRRGSRASTTSADLGTSAAFALRLLPSRRQGDHDVRAVGQHVWVGRLLAVNSWPGMMDACLSSMPRSQSAPTGLQRPDWPVAATKLRRPSGALAPAAADLDHLRTTFGDVAQQDTSRAIGGGYAP
jgi:hypothetical protein